MNLCVLSACYERPEMAAVLKESCEHFWLPLHWCAARELNGHWSGDLRVSKLVAAYEALDELQGRYSHVMWVDGFDAFVQADASIIASGLDMLGCPPMVFSGEKNCWPDPGLAVDYPASNSPWRFINAGTWLAQVGYLRDVICDIIDWKTDNDQAIWSDLFLLGHLPGAVIDTNRLIFQTMWGTELSELRGSCVVHYNGGDVSKYATVREHWERVKAGEIR